MSSCPPPQKSTLDGLPKQFVSAMRTLFDIMDDKKIGYVKFSEIESRWQEDGAKGLPKGVIESLRKVTPANGHLSFERFCAGLKICLLRHAKANQCNSSGSDVSSADLKPTLKYPASHHSPNSSSGNKISISDPRGVIPGLLACRPSSVPLPERAVKKESELCKAKPAAVLRPAAGDPSSLRASSSSATGVRSNHVNTATVRPNNAIAQQRAISMPHLQQDSNKSNNRNGQPVFADSTSVRGLRGYKSELRINTASSNADKDRFGIMTALNNWRMGMLANQMTSDGRNSASSLMSSQAGGVGILSEFSAENGFSRNAKNTFQPLNLGFNGNCDLTGDAKCTTSENRPIVNSIRSITNCTDDAFMKYAQETGPAARKAMNRRREPRRHTVANGIDYNMLKRMKQLEQEREVLLHGLEAVERAREWYLRNINNIEEKIRYGGKVTAFSESSTDAHQERLNFQMARIFEVNQHLWALMESSEKGFPLHMNLAVRQPPFYNKMQLDSSQGIIQRLKEQNRMLTEEVSKKSERITQLEREKSALIRELFQSRSQHRREPDETTFM